VLTRVSHEFTRNTKHATLPVFGRREVRFVVPQPAEF